MFTYLINTMLKIARGKSVADYGGLPEGQVLLYILQKGFIAAIRGLFVRVLLGSVKGMLFIGKGVNIISPSKLYAGNNFFIGNYSYINCYSKNGVHVGDNVTIREFAWLQLTSSVDNPGEDIVIGDGTYIGPRVNLGAGAGIKIGSHCQIGANVSFVGENHLFDQESKIYDQGVTRKGIIIGDDCWFGNGVVVLDGVTVGDGVVIGAGSVVNKDLPSFSIAVGVPARIIRTRNLDSEE